MKVALGSDHGGYELKEHLKKMLEQEGIEFIDCGCDGKPCDYPVYAKKVAELVLDGSVDKGILVCGTGIGISIAANKIDGIRCANVSNTVSARLSREHNDSNVVALGGRIIGPVLAEEIVKVFLSTPFSEGERHINRIKQFDITY